MKLFNIMSKMKSTPDIINRRLNITIKITKKGGEFKDIAIEIKVKHRKNKDRKSSE